MTRHRGALATALVTVLALVVAACGDTTGTADTPPPTQAATDDTPQLTGADAAPDQPTTTTEPLEPGYVSEIYADPTHWLCLPERSDDACDIELDITRVEADGTTVFEPFQRAVDPAIDCFYVYPTVSEDEAPNSGLAPTDAERRAVRAQFAQFGSVCRTFAPMYRQITRAALFGNADGIPDRGLAFADVDDAWSHYLANHNQGRGVVLIGHSQGAGHLRELLTRRIDLDPGERDLLVSAILLGTTARTPRHAPTGAHFQHLAPCRNRSDTGCIVSFSTYAADEPPGEIGYFAGVRDNPDERAVCTNPAALAGGASPLDSIIPSNPIRDGDIDTPFVRYSGLATGECVESGVFHYLEARYDADPEAQWPPELGGRITQQWGLHLIDANIALGDLIELVRAQARSW